MRNSTILRPLFPLRTRSSMIRSAFHTSSPYSVSGPTVSEDVEDESILAAETVEKLGKRCAAHATVFFSMGVRQTAQADSQKAAEKLLC